MLSDHMAGFGPYHHLFSCPQQEGFWLCHPSSCLGTSSFSSPETCFSFSSLGPYRRLYHDRLCRGGGEGCETFHVHVRGHDRHGPTCGVETHAYHNARPMTEDSWPTALRLVRELFCAISSRTYLDAQTGAFKVSSMPVKEKALRSYLTYLDKDIHVVVGIFGVALAAKFHKGITTGGIRGAVERSCFSR